MIKKTKANNDISNLNENVKKAIVEVIAIHRDKFRSNFPSGKITKDSENNFFVTTSYPASVSITTNEFDELVDNGFIKGFHYNGNVTVTIDNRYRFGNLAEISDILTGDFDYTNAVYARRDTEGRYEWVLRETPLTTNEFISKHIDPHFQKDVSYDLKVEIVGILVLLGELKYSNDAYRNGIKSDFYGDEGVSLKSLVSAISRLDNDVMLELLRSL